MKLKIDDRILEVLGDGESHDEWDIAVHLYPWDNTNRSKHGAWIRVIVQALWRLSKQGKVGYFWVGHGDGVAGDRIWLKSRL